MSCKAEGAVITSAFFFMCGEFNIRLVIQIQDEHSYLFVVPEPAEERVNLHLEGVLTAYAWYAMQKKGCLDEPSVAQGEAGGARVKC